MAVKISVTSPHAGAGLGTMPSSALLVGVVDEVTDSDPPSEIPAADLTQVSVGSDALPNPLQARVLATTVELPPRPGICPIDLKWH